MRESTHFGAKEVTSDPCGPRELSAAPFTGSREFPWLTWVKVGSSTPIRVPSRHANTPYATFNGNNTGANKFRGEGGRSSLGKTKRTHGSPPWDVGRGVPWSNHGLNVSPTSILVLSPHGMDIIRICEWDIMDVRAWKCMESMDPKKDVNFQAFGTFRTWEHSYEQESRILVYLSCRGCYLASLHEEKSRGSGRGSR
ncbi:hypothetical protein CDL15_Pgr024840 [Punica granatum]|uniref:Uncharacterized protein n=2 Tax=Punica granatum TaxID=22663 RepID=A0A218XD16_PUNGR|nr:hypothetical protein CDL15_Pgr024840 [Punica granatum]